MFSKEEENILKTEQPWVQGIPPPWYKPLTLPRTRTVGHTLSQGLTASIHAISFHSIRSFTQAHVDTAACICAVLTAHTTSVLIKENM